MQSQLSLPVSSLEDVIRRIFETHRITRADQEQLMALMLSKSALSDIDKNHVNRIFDGLSSGLVRVID
ncbi:hypothetical protein [Leptolyngbya sp. CCY15150]|uniref:hypothetical protein n=1 Tax=Leptolyngbya sp. CCY15150 TaxID=2767772 RepID=UPI00194E3621|nr:hypothetical protein [Leptolyngbya sp. CCY15150]